MIQADAAEAEIGIRAIRPEDFGWIVRQHQKQIYRVLLFLMRDEDAAETLTQECFLRAFKKHGSFRGESNVTTWLVRIAINLAHDHHRNRRWVFWQKLTRTDRMDAMRVVDAQRSAEQILADKESLDAVRSAAERLSEQQRTAFLLRFVEDMPLEAIAEVMGLKLGTVKTHLSRAVETIRSICMDRGISGRTEPASLELNNARAAQQK